MLTPELLEVLTRFLSYKWEWRLITKIINYKYNLHFVKEALEAEYLRVQGEL